MRSLVDPILSPHRCTTSMGLLFGVGVGRGLTFVTATMVMEGSLLCNEEGGR